MTSNEQNSLEQLYFVQGEDEDENIILEGTDLHETLLNMGYTDFNSVPRAEIKDTLHEADLSIKNFHSIKDKFHNKLYVIYQYLSQENRLRAEQLKIILQANILLDDHVEMINDLFVYQQTSPYIKILEWLPFLGSTISASLCTLIGNKQNITKILAAFTVFGYSVYEKCNYWLTIRKLKYLVMMQNDLHNLIKQCLKILRRTYGRKKIITEACEEHELLGNEKVNIIFSIKQLIVEILKNLSKIYYQEANNVLNILPYFLQSNCILTKFESGHKQVQNDTNYDEIRSLYYSFILVQSEMMFILANAYNGRVQHKFCRISNSKLSEIVKNLDKPLTFYYLKLSKIMQSYKLSEIQPVRRVFRGIPNSKWQDVYIHLDLTSQRIQLAFKEILSIIESIDTNTEQNEDNQRILTSITDKMNEAYKQIENARSFAEFTSLLIAKIQHKSDIKEEKKIEDESFLPVNKDNRTVVMIDKEPVIEDEVFEEYIKEEYLKPLYESSDESVLQNFKLDKLLAKIFMSELKEVLIEKQKSMTERELKALKRMYEKVQKNSLNKNNGSEKNTDSENIIPSISAQPPSSSNTTSPSQLLLLTSSIPQAPPLPPSSLAPSPPPHLVTPVISESNINNENLDLKNACNQKPLPRVKILQTEDIIPDAQRFSLSECTPNYSFPRFKVEEETFVGSGENSEEEIENNSEDDESANLN